MPPKPDQDPSGILSEAPYPLENLHTADGIQGLTIAQERGSNINGVEAADILNNTSEMPASHPEVDARSISVEGLIKVCPYFSGLAANNPDLARAEAAQAIQMKQKLDSLRQTGMSEEEANAQKWSLLREQFKQKLKDAGKLGQEHEAEARNELPGHILDHEALATHNARIYEEANAQNTTAAQEAAMSDLAALAEREQRLHDEYQAALVNENVYVDQLMHEQRSAESREDQDTTVTSKVQAAPSSPSREAAHGDDVVTRRQTVEIKAKGPARENALQPDIKREQRGRSGVDSSGNTETFEETVKSGKGQFALEQEMTEEDGEDSQVSLMPGRLTGILSITAEVFGDRPVEELTGEITNVEARVADEISVEPHLIIEDFNEALLQLISLSGEGQVHEETEESERISLDEDKQTETNEIQPLSLVPDVIIKVTERFMQLEASGQEAIAVSIAEVMKNFHSVEKLSDEGDQTDAERQNLEASIIRLFEQIGLEEYDQEDVRDFIALLPRLQTMISRAKAVQDNEVDLEREGTREARIRLRQIVSKLSDAENKIQGFLGKLILSYLIGSRPKIQMPAN